MTYYKIVEKVKDNTYKFLYHERRKTFKVGDTLNATKKMVYEAYDKKTKEKKLYMSGIHVIESLELCQKYLTYFKNKQNKTILLVEVSCVTKKLNARKGVLLADQVTIISELI